MRILRFVISVHFLLLGIFLKAQTIIDMEESGGVFKIPCLVNGARMKLIFDTGASTVCISQSMAEYLLENDYLSSEDFVGEGQAIVADGTIVDHKEVILKDIEISGHHIHNVKAAVIEGQKAPLLLGQSAIQKLGRIEILGNTLKIINTENSLSEEDADKLFEKINYYRSIRMFSLAAECYETLYKNDYLSDIGKHSYGVMLYLSDNYAKSLNILLSIENKQAVVNDKQNIYRTIANVYLSMNNYTEAIKYYQKALADYAHNTHSDKVGIYSSMAACYEELGKFYDEYSMYAYALDEKAKSLGVTMNYLINDCDYKLPKHQQSVKDEEAERIWFYALKASWNSKQMTWDTFEYTTLRLGAKGNKSAILFWEAGGIDCYQAFKTKYGSY